LLAFESIKLVNQNDFFEAQRLGLTIVIEVKYDPMLFLKDAGELDFP
jgi:hypothetical protein